MPLVAMMMSTGQLLGVQLFRVEPHLINKCLPKTHLSGGPGGWVGTALTGGDFFHS